MHKGITKLENILEGVRSPQFTSEEYMQLYTEFRTIYDLSTQKHPHDYSVPLYVKYREAFEEYINAMVYWEIRAIAREVVISLINHEREGEQIDRALLKYVLDILMEIGSRKIESYEIDLEAFLLEDTAQYYSKKASNWIAVQIRC